AEAARAAHEDPAHTHVGYFLIDKGVSALEGQLGYRPRFKARALRAVQRHATIAYLGTLSFLVTLIVAALVLALIQIHAGAAITVLTALLAFIPAGELAVSLLNWDLTHMFGPKLLPKIDLAKGIPADARTMIVVPALLCDEKSV